MGRCLGRSRGDPATAACRAPAKFIILNTTFLVFNAQFLVLVQNSSVSVTCSAASLLVHGTTKVRLVFLFPKAFAGTTRNLSPLARPQIKLWSGTVGWCLTDDGQIARRDDGGVGKSMVSIPDPGSFLSRRICWGGLSHVAGCEVGQKHRSGHPPGC